jgi:hypothetical protein
MRTLIRLLGAAAIGVALTLPVHADEALDRIFDATQLDNVETGQALGFTHERKTIAPDRVPAITDRDITVAVGGKAEGKDAREVLVTIAEGKRESTLDAFLDDGGNPVLVIFLESVAQAVAKSTGGSPFYIKNRIKDAFSRGTEVASTELIRDGKPVEAVRIVYNPFALEKQKERLQNFVNFEMAFILSRSVPGGIVEMRALDNPGDKGFEEFMVLDGMTDAEQ